MTVIASCLAGMIACSKPPKRMLGQSDCHGWLRVADPPSEDEGDLTSNHVTDLVEYLDGSVILPLSQAEKSMLATIAQATVEVRSYRR